MALTVKDVKAARWDGGQSSTQYMWDKDGTGTGETVPGFGVRLYESGKKSYVLGYRNRAGRFRIIAIGSTTGMTLSEARKDASRLRGEADRGSDPQVERRKAREAEKRSVRFKDFTSTYISRMEGRWTERTKKEYQRRIEKHLRPAFGSRRLTEISRSDVAGLLDRIAQKSGPYESNRVHELLRSMYNRAAIWGYLPEDRPNPARAIERFKESSRDRWLRPEEVSRLIREVRNYTSSSAGVRNSSMPEARTRGAAADDGEGGSKKGKGKGREVPSTDPYFRAFIPLLLLTGLRKNELLRARWADVDLELGEIRLPETKSGRPQVRKLSEPAVQIFRFIPGMKKTAGRKKKRNEEKENPFVFPGRAKGTHRRDFRNEWQVVREAAGLTDVTLHDLRRTAGSYMAQAGVPLQTIGELLGHQHPSVTRVYARLSEENEREAVEALGSKLESLFETATR